MRQKYYDPLKIEENVPLPGSGIFMKICSCSQQDSKVLCSSETYGLPDRHPQHTTALIRQYNHEYTQLADLF